MADPYYNSLALWLPMRGADGGTAFADESPTNKTVEVYGNTRTSTVTSKNYGSSGYFDGAGDYLRIPYSADLNFSNPTYTVETYFRLNVVGNLLFAKDTYGVNYDFSISVVNSTTLRCSTNKTFTTIDWTVPAMVPYVWYHVAIVRNAGILTLYFNGVSCGTRSSTVTNDSQSYVTIGCSSWNNPGGFLNGNLEDFSILMGIARYTSNFTPPGPRLDPSVSGVVIGGNGTPAARTVYLYERATGNLLGKTVSDATTGLYNFYPLPGSEVIRVVLADEPTLYNDIVDRIILE